MNVPGNIQHVTIGDQEFNAIEQQFEIAQENWNEYKLLDGGSVRVKLTVSRIFRIVNEDSVQIYNDDGDPELIVRHRADIVASA